MLLPAAFAGPDGVLPASRDRQILNCNNAVSDEVRSVFAMEIAVPPNLHAAAATASGNRESARSI